MHGYAGWRGVMLVMMVMMDEEDVMMEDDSKGKREELTTGISGMQRKALTSVSTSRGVKGPTSEESVLGGILMIVG